MKWMYVCYFVCGPGLKWLRWFCGSLGCSTDRPHGRKSGAAGLVNGVLLTGRRWPAYNGIGSPLFSSTKIEKKNLSELTWTPSDKALWTRA